jgi:arginyl-tRNA synthetase
MNLGHLLRQQARQALMGLVADVESAAALLKPTADPRHGDYQLNCALALARQLGRAAPQLAQDIVARWPASDFLEPPQVAGPGFINLRFRTDWLARQLAQLAGDERLGIPTVPAPRTIVLDYSSPNIAKPMHVGHLRSTILGDSLTRLLRFLGHRVLTDNHLGDWGTQLGMLLYGYKHFRDDAALAADPVREMARLYKRVHDLIKPAQSEEEDDLDDAPAVSPAAGDLAQARQVLQAVRQETAKLHAGDPENLQLWRTFLPWCLEELQRTYRRLDILPFDYTLGESFYHPFLPEVVEDLLRRGIARPGQRGAIVIGPENAPAVIRKADGAFTYMTTDLATLRYRMTQWNPDAILYVVDARQALHFQTLFEAARRWGYERVELQHISFGTVLGPDHRPLRTREGTTVALNDLLDAAVAQAAQEYERSRRERQQRGEEVPELTPAERQQLEEAVGIGAVKYADLSQNRNSDYVFNLQKMVSFEGNTATYLQYAYVRTRSIGRKAPLALEDLRRQPPIPRLGTPAERALALALLRFEEALSNAAADYQPCLVAAYLWDLARTFSTFYQQCPVLRAATADEVAGRLLLCDLTARTLQCGLYLLGIRTVEHM